MTHPASPAHFALNLTPQSTTLAGYPLETVRQTLLEHRWHTRRTARALKVPYRTLDAFRREHQLFSPTHLKRSGLVSGQAGSSADVRIPAPPGVLETPREFGSAPRREATLESLTQWARRQDLNADRVKALRIQERIAPLYRFGPEDQATYYTRPDAQVLERNSRSPIQHLEGYVALHTLERDYGPLRLLAQKLCQAGTLHLVGAYPTLLSDRDAAVLLEAHREQSTGRATRTGGGKTPRPALFSGEVRGAALERRPASPSSPSPASLMYESAPHSLEPVDSASGAQVGSPLELPFHPQAGFIVVPRFEVLHPETSGKVWDVFDRGAQGEHLGHPQHLARFYSEAVRQVFPHASQRRGADLPPTHLVPIPLAPAPPLPGPAAEVSRVDPTPSLSHPPEETSAQQREQLELLVQFEQENTQLEAALRELRAQLETAQAQLSTLEARERERPPQPVSRGEAASPEASKALLEALRERDALRVRLEIVEARLRDLEGDAQNSQGKRTRPYLLDHVRKQLSKRFHFRLTAERVRALDVEARAAPSVGYTREGQPFKLITVEGQAVYAIVGQDEQGQACLVTVYTRDMFERAEVLKGAFSARG